MNVFVLVHSDSPSGPVKGAYAIVNELVKRGVNCVHLVFVHSGPGANQPLDPRVINHCLQIEKVGFFNALKTYKSLLSKFECSSVVSLSLCFKSDLINSFMSKDAFIYSSIRGNLFINYKRDHRVYGFLMAVFHLLVCRRFNEVFVLSDSMKRQVERFISKEAILIRNFVDEIALEKFRIIGKKAKKLRLGFLGSLSKRKRPFLAIDTLETLIRQGYDVQLDVVGNGELTETLELYADQKGVLSSCKMHGFSKHPFKILSHCDVLIAPSESEGTSRAVMEALYLGVPCVVFDVDGMGELVKNEINGMAVKSAEELPDAVLMSKNLTNYNGVLKQCILPEAYRQKHVVDSMIKVICER